LVVEPFLRAIFVGLVVLAAGVMAHLQPLIAASAAFTVALMGTKLTGGILAHLHLHRRSR
jgi:hypothetical protein